MEKVGRVTAGSRLDGIRNIRPQKTGPGSRSKPAACSCLPLYLRCVNEDEKGMGNQLRTYQLNQPYDTSYHHARLTEKVQLQWEDGIAI